MSDPCRRVVLVSDFNARNFAGYLQAEPVFSEASIEVAPFGQVIPSLVQRDSELWKTPADLVVVWTRPESVIDSYRELASFAATSQTQVLDEVDRFASYVLQLQDRARLVVVPTWVAPAYQRGWGPLDMRSGRGLANTLMRMNLRLADAFGDTPGFIVMDAQRWLVHGGRHGSSPKLWHMAKVPFGNEVFKEAARDAAALVEGARGGARKLVVVDLDDTVWGGVVGEVGWPQLRLGGHDHVGEAFADFQRALQALTRRGIVLAIASKNDEAVALEALTTHPEMVLRLEDFAARRINWQDKAQNIADLSAELNLGLQSVVFIDDNPVERARVREALPEVLVPDWPEDPLLYGSTLAALRCFDAPSISREDEQRTALYGAEHRRAALRHQAGDVLEWLESLDCCVHIDPLSASSLPRAAQLLNKTNQMNLSTRRLTEAELARWANEPGNTLWTLRVVDRFGDAGLTGLVGLTIEPPHVRLVDFVLSCRVMGRQVEESMLHLAVEHARLVGAEAVVAQYAPTPKNKPCLEFFDRSGFAKQGEPVRFVWQTSRPYPSPGAITIAEHVSAHFSRHA